jgi:hypothetical protein
MDAATPELQILRTLVRRTWLAARAHAPVRLGSRVIYARTGRASASHAFAPMALRAVDARLFDRRTASGGVQITGFQFKSRSVGGTTSVSTSDNGAVSDPLGARPWAVVPTETRGATFDDVRDDDLDWAR